jgi:hypothetical protein
VLYYALRRERLANSCSRFAFRQRSAEPFLSIFLKDITRMNSDGWLSLAVQIPIVVIFVWFSLQLISSFLRSIETLTASFDAAGYTVAGVTNQANGGTLQEQRLFYLTPKLSWRFSEWWRVEASYSYRWRDVETFIEPVTSNTLMFLLTYYPPKLAISN